VSWAAVGGIQLPVEMLLRGGYFARYRDLI
jgi:hypothetical protein